MRKILLSLCVLAAVGLPLRAQFFLSGNDPSRLRWYSLESDHYRVIFPEGADSLARAYARSLEQFREPLGRSLGGMTPGEGWRSKLPVVLHTSHVLSNGMLGWAPSRMELYTESDAYDADPTPWIWQLTAHEPRHQAQLQFGSRGILPWITGQAWAPVYWQLYLEQAYGEGDAVVAETGLLGGTRARTADFLDYYRVALDQGDYRSWDRWRYGSFKHYAPDHYALGYLTLAGARTLYHRPLLVREALDLSWKKPWYIAPFNTQKIISTQAGKPFKQAFRDIQDAFVQNWREQAALRGPFMPMEEFLPRESYAMEYSSLVMTSVGMLALRESKQVPREVVLLRDGKPRHLFSYASHASFLYYNEALERIYWTETRPHPRWSLAGTSVVCYYELLSGRTGQLTHGTRYYNPQIGRGGDVLSVLEYPEEGGSALVVLDARSGAVLRRHPLPEGVQGTESAWMDEDIYVCGISQGGTGLYRLSPDEQWSCVLAPSHQKLAKLSADEDRLEWESDRSGVNELYFFYPSENKLFQVTASRYGAADFVSDDQYLYGISTTREGRSLFRTPLAALQPRAVRYDALAAHPVEDALTAQERELGPAPDLQAAVTLTAPRRYYKWAHPLRLHSWLPLYVDYDAVKEGSMDFSYETASPGVSLFSQNTLGTLYGMIGYAIHPDANGRWRSALHARMTYTGLYPVIEAQLSLKEEDRNLYQPMELSDGEVSRFQLTAITQGSPLFTASLLSYIPLSFSRGGLHYGVTPQIRYNVSSQVYSRSTLRYSAPVYFQGLPATYRLTELPAQVSGPWMQQFTASARAYLTTSRADSQAYPRWGLGLESGIGFRPGLVDQFASQFYAYAYGYLPGLTRLQGLRWSLIGQRFLGEEVRFKGPLVNTLPRGYTETAFVALPSQYAWQWKGTLDYAIPIYVGDISIPGVAYIRNFQLVPHADAILPRGGDSLWSVGADFSASLARLLFLPFDASVGLSFSYLGGTLYQYTGQGKPCSVSMIFSMDF